MLPKAGELMLPKAGAKAGDDEGVLRTRPRPRGGVVGESTDIAGGYGYAALPDSGFGDGDSAFELRFDDTHHSADKSHHTDDKSHHTDDKSHHTRTSSARDTPRHRTGPGAGEALTQTTTSTTPSNTSNSRPITSRLCAWFIPSMRRPQVTTKTKTQFNTRHHTKQPH